MRNKTKKTIIVKKITIWYRFLPKILGLMFRKRIHDEGFVFVWDTEGKRGIHMWFVFFPIDVLYLDRKKKVVDLVQDLKPWSMHSPKRKAQYIVELPAGSIRKSGTDVGDGIEF